MLVTMLIKPVTLSPLLLLLCLELSIIATFGVVVGQQQPSQSSSVSQTLAIIQARGFKGEEYHIKSYDGSPLALYHVINPLADQRTLYKYPVIIFHGLGGDSTQMVSHSVDSRARKPIIGQVTALGGDECMAFMFSNNNFDVWLIDSRGVNLNNRNVSVDTNWAKSQQFWKYSLDEQALYDAPKQIDFVLQQTQTQKALVVTYSESTFLLFALLSAAPDYATKLASLVALAPTAYVTHIRGLAVPLMASVLMTPENIDGNVAPTPFEDTVGMSLRRVCSIKIISSLICQQVSQIIAGGQESNSEEADFFSTIARSSSLRVFKHFAQLHQQNRFGMYDYGPQENLLKYGQAKAPNYDLGKVRLPTVILVRGGRDFLSNQPDQERLIRELGVKPILDIRLPHYNHLDFVVNSNLINDVNLPITQMFVQILWNDVNSPGTLTLDPSAPVPMGRQKADVIVEPNYAAKRIIITPVRMFRNFVDSMELKPGMSLLPPNGRENQAFSKGIYNLVDNVDRFAASLNSVPDMIQERVQLAIPTLG